MPEARPPPVRGIRVSSPSYSRPLSFGACNMLSLRNYSGNVFRFSENVPASYGNQPVSLVGVSWTRDYLVIGGSRDDLLVPTHEVAISEDVRAAFDAQLARANNAIVSS